MQASSWRLRYAAYLLRYGGVVAYPTEAVFGLGCDPRDEFAVERLLRLKARPLAKGLILIGSRFEQLLPFVGPLASDIRERVQHSWPGPVTWLLPAAAGLPDWLRGEHDTIAVRVTAHPLASALCSAFDGALVSTSANPSGLPPARDPLTVRRYFGDDIDYVLHGTVDKHRKPTEIRDAQTDRVIRNA